MRVTSLMGGLSAAFAATGLAGAAFAQQTLEIVGRPVVGAMGFQPPVTVAARDLQGLDHMLLIIITAITLFVTALLVWVMIRYNQRANPKPATFTHNSPLEVAWTVVPIVILVFIGAYSLPVLFEEQEIPVADVTIKATGNQWYWNYAYVDTDVAFDSYMIGSPATGGDNRMSPEVEKMLVDAGYSKDEFLLAADTAMVVPVNKNVVVQVTGSDVIHAFMVPALGVQISAVPGRLGQAWFKAEKEGIYFGQCTTLCGQAHAYMPIVVKVVSEEAYAAWLEKAKGGDFILSATETPAKLTVAQAD